MTTAIAWKERSGAYAILDVDAVLREGMDSTSEITENPVERGAEIADHIRHKSDILTLEFRITNNPVRAPQSHAGSGDGRRTQNADGSTVLTFDGPLERVKRVHDDLQRVRKAGLFWDIQTTLRRYENYLLENIKVARDNKTGDAATFILTLREVRLVDTRIASIPRLRRIQPRVNAGVQPTQRPRESLLHVGQTRAAATLSSLGITP